MMVSNVAIGQLALHFAMLQVVFADDRQDALRADQVLGAAVSLFEHRQFASESDKLFG